MTIDDKSSKKNKVISLAKKYNKLVDDFEKLYEDSQRFLFEIEDIKAENEKLKAENEQLKKEIDLLYLRFKVAKDNNCFLLAKNEELKKELENSIKLPCKVGDTVYRVLNVEWEIGEFVIYHISYIENDHKVIRYNAECHSHEDINDILFYDDDIDKTVFLAREEAEAKLKELRENEKD